MSIYLAAEAFMCLNWIMHQKLLGVINTTFPKSEFQDIPKQGFPIEDYDHIFEKQIDYRQYYTDLIFLILAFC